MENPAKISQTKNLGMKRKLIINADDYGICREVNRAVEHLIRLQKLRDVSVLANGECYSDTVDFLAGRPSVSVGVHLNVVEGRPLSATKEIGMLLDANGQFAALVRILGRWLRAPKEVSKAVEIEWRQQIERLLRDGIEMTHADSHQHIHAFPPFWRILVKLCREYGIAGLRFPCERNALQSRRISSTALAQTAGLAKTFCPPANLYLISHFLGFKRAGAYGEKDMIEDLRNLKEGITEMTIHPSIRHKKPYMHMNGELEYRALLGAKIPETIDKTDIELISWTDLVSQPKETIENEAIFSRS